MVESSEILSTDRVTFFNGCNLKGAGNETGERCARHKEHATGYFRHVHFCHAVDAFVYL